MNMFKNLFYATLSMGVCASALAAATPDKNDAVEEETTKPRAVLFKIHEIKPVENTEGEITNCDFLVTFYNRTTDSMRQAKIEMGWTDKVSERYAIGEDKKPEENDKALANKRQPLNARNAQPALGEVTTTVEMPALGSYKQATVRASVKTEKCFMLLDSLDYNVTSCNIIGKSDNSNSNDLRRSRIAASRNTGECANLFQYVDSKNPEYYNEFKNISYSEQERLLANEKAQDTTEMEETYGKIIKNLEKANSVIADIK